MKIYDRSDLACEIRTEQLTTNKDYSINRYELFGYEVIQTEILSSTGESKSGKKIGKYFTLCCGSGWMYDGGRQEGLALAIGQVLKKLIVKADRILVLGLGNRFITSDSLGPLTSDKLSSIHVQGNKRKISSIAPGVSGQTGMDVSDIAKAIVNLEKPDCIIAIDSLCARDVQRLSTTIQLSDTGIVPGSGVNNHKKEISHSTVGTPVISIGVPTAVSTSTLIFSVLSQAKLEQKLQNFTKILDTGLSFFVTPTNCDELVENMSAVISRGIIKAVE